MSSSNPVLVDALRGDMIESCHRGAAAVADVNGKLVAAWGDVEQPVFSRSAIKPVQALPLIESGAADRFGLNDEEIALACASHGAEPAHVERLTRWLVRIGVNESDLECGPHLPLNEQASADLLRSGQQPSPLHNNCSGKHAGFLTTAVHLGEPVRGYIRAEHPVQQRARRVLEEMSGADLTDAPAGIDGCGVPVVGLSLRATARAMALLACPEKLAPARAAAAARVLRAMTRQPFMVAGSGRFCTDVMRTGAAVAVKIGAEGAFTAALPGRCLGVALKIDDGAGRAASVAMGAILQALGVLRRGVHEALASHLRPRVRNHAGVVVGSLRPAAGWLESIR
ncbi:MAG: asparaginase [Acidiferrobacterales bacterium]